MLVLLLFNLNHMYNKEKLALKLSKSFECHSKVGAVLFKHTNEVLLQRKYASYTLNTVLPFLNLNNKKHQTAVHKSPAFFPSRTPQIDIRQQNGCICIYRTPIYTQRFLEFLQGFPPIFRKCTKPNYLTYMYRVKL